MTAHIPHGPLMAAQHVQAMAGQTDNNKLAWTLTAMSAALIGMMVIKEARELFRDKDTHGHFQDRSMGRGR